MSNDTLRLPDYLSCIERIKFPWDDAYWMRNVLAHGYFQVDLDIVWQTITVDLPLLLAQVRAMLD